MKIKTKILLVLFLATLLTSCDPPHSIDFINDSDSIAKVKLNLYPQTDDFDLEQIATGDSIVLNIKQKDTATIEFGMGDWAEEEIDHVTDAIKSIEIETREIKTVYKTKKAMKGILEKNRQGFFLKTKIKIAIE